MNTNSEKHMRGKCATNNIGCGMRDGFGLASKLRARSTGSIRMAAHQQNRPCGKAPIYSFTHSNITLEEKETTMI